MSIRVEKNVPLSEIACQVLDYPCLVPPVGSILPDGWRVERVKRKPWGLRLTVRAPRHHPVSAA